METKTQILTNSIKSQKDLTKRNGILFSKLLEDCHNIPFWIPEPEEYYDYNIDHVVKLFESANSEEEIDEIIKQLAENDYSKYKHRYEYHAKLHNETLQQSYNDYIDGKLPDPSFIRPKCCFNHYIGLPKKGETELKIFDYELYLIYLFLKLKRIDILKSRGLGVTELVLRFILWRIVKDTKWSFRMGAIITGLRMHPAIKLIKRLKELLDRRFPVIFETSQSEFILNNVTVQAFPSKNSANTLRSYPDFCFIILDEADFFKLSDQIEVRHAAEGYFLKSQPLMIWISTPNKPNGIMEQFRNDFIKRTNIFSDTDTPYQFILDKPIQIENYDEYFHVELPYFISLGKIYNQEYVKTEKQKDYFPREFLLQFGYGIGNFLSETDINKCFLHQYNPFEYFEDTMKIMTIDQGLGSSKFAIMVTEFIPYPYQYNITDTLNYQQPFLIRMLYNDEFFRPNPSEMENRIQMLIDKYKIVTNNRIGKVGIDGANIGLIKKVKEMIGEDVYYDQVYSQLKLEERNAFLLGMKVMPINFGTLQRNMMFTLHDYVTKGFYAINRNQFTTVIGQLRIATATDKGLEKEKGGSTFDSFDCLRMDSYIHSLI